MADRPTGGSDGTGGSGPERGTPEYDWLYGTSTSSPGGGAGGNAGGANPPTEPRPAQPGPSADDQATQVFRTQGGQGATPPPPAGSRPGSGSGSDDPYDLYGGSSARYEEPPPRRPVPPPGQAPVPPPPGQPPAKRSRSRRPRFRARYLLVLLVLWLVFILVVPVIAYFRIDRVDAFAENGRPDNQPGTNYLIVGSDSREDLSAEERRELGTGDAAGRRTDTIMMLHVGRGPNLLMSIPRDLEVDIPGNGTSKVNAAYAIGGPKLLTRTIEANFGTRVDHYVEIGFGGFVDIVDGVGGIEVCPDEAIDDPLAKLRIRRGCQEVDGEKALGYARTRKFANGDITRGENQREVVSAVGAKALSPWSVINPVRWWRLNIAAAGSLRVSDGTGPYALGRFAFAMTRVDGDNGLTCTVPIAGITNPLVRDTERSETLFNRIIEDDTQRIGRQLCTPTGLPQ